MTQLPQTTEAERGITIRDHLVPLIETASVAHAMNGASSASCERRAERKAYRVARLLLAIQEAAAAWAASEYEAGLSDGRFGTGAAHIEWRRSVAEARFRDVAARLSAAVTPPAADAAQGRLLIKQR